MSTATMETETIIPAAPRESAEEAMPWGALLRLITVTAAVFLSMAVVTPTLAELMSLRFGEGTNPSPFMLAHSLPQLLCLGLFAGIVSDRWGRRLPLALAGCFGTGISTILIPLIDGYGALLALRVVDGFLGIIGIAMLMTRALDIGGASHRGKIMAFFTTSIPLGWLAGSALPVIVEKGGGGLEAVYGIAGAIVCVASLLLLVDLRRPERIVALAPGLAAVTSVLRRMPRLWLPMLFGMVDRFSFGLLAMLPALVLSDLYGETGFFAPGVVMTSFWIAFALGSVCVGGITRRIGPWQLVAIGSAGYGACFVLCTAFDTPTGFLIFLTGAGVFTALQYVPNLLLVGQFAGPEEKGTAISAFNLLGSLGLIAGLAYAGWASKAIGYFGTFAFVGVLEILCAVLALAAAGKYLPGIRESKSLSPTGATISHPKGNLPT